MGRGNVRNAALVIAAGAFAYLVGDYFDVFGLVANPFDFADAAERVAALQADKTAWDVSNVLAGVGHVVTAIGLWMLGRSLAQSSNERRSQVLATAASWAGLATGVWAVNSYFARQTNRGCGRGFHRPNAGIGCDRPNLRVGSPNPLRDPRVGVTASWTHSLASLDTVDSRPHSCSVGFCNRNVSSNPPHVRAGIGTIDITRSQAA